MMKTQRDAGVGPWISIENIREFCQWLTDNNIRWRDHVGAMSRGYQVRHDGHWMALLWNKGFQRYTADRRLSLIVQSFASERAQQKQISS